MAYRSNIYISEITDDLIPDAGTVVFDWDNTLKLYDRANRKLSSRVDKTNLKRWKTEKQCDMYIISAIYPSRINLETLLFEVGKLELLEFFIKVDDKVEVNAGKFARKGNIIICGYDKAETFIKVTQHKMISKDFGRTLDKPAKDVADCLDYTDGSSNTAERKINSADTTRTLLNYNQVVFFDDEEVNIINFRALVKNSKCYLVE